MGYFPYLAGKPLVGEIVVVKKKFPIRHSRYILIPVRITIFPNEWLPRSWGNLSSVFLLSLSWRNIIVPFMTHREFFLSPFFKMTGLTFLLGL